MKFSCPSCQAKYQLADEKVAGRTVKMKCRKCGTVVPVNADGVVTDALSADGAPLVSMMPAPPSVAPRAGAIPRPAAAVKPGAPVPKPVAPAAAGAVAASPVKASTATAALSRPAASALPKPVASSAAAPGTVPKAGVPSAVSKAVAPSRAAVPAASKAAVPAPRATPATAESAGASPRRASANVAKPAADLQVVEAPVPEIAASPEELAGPPSMRRLASRAPVAIPEWFAGVDGAPLGPMTREELRSKVDAKVVTGDTLVWRDGMSGWVAMSAVPDVSDLLLVRDPIALVPAPGPAPSAVTSPAPPEEASSTTGLNFEKSANAEAAFFAAVDARPAARIPKPAAESVVGALHGERAGTATIQLPEPTFGGGGAPESSVPPRPSMWMRARQRSVSKGQIAVAVGGAIAFGIAMGFVLFSGSGETKIVKEIVEVRVPVAAVAAPPPPPVVDEPGSTVGVTTAAAGTARSNSSGASPAPSPSSTGKATGDGGLKGLAGLADAGVAGPTLGSGTGSNSGAGSQPLESAQIQSTVSKYQSAVKRGCWEPALSARDKDAPSSARVTVSIQVTAAGTVQSATGSGDPRGYRGLSSCIERRVLAWQFPRSSGTTTVKVPFVFAAQ